MRRDRSAVWRVVGASVVGSAHLADGTACQDHFFHAVVADPSGVEVLLAAVADGASFATFGAAAANTAVCAFEESVVDTLSVRAFASLGEAECHEWLRVARQAVLERARVQGLTPRDFSCTFAAAVVARETGFAMQIGDGMVMLRRVDETAWQLAFWPQKGEYRNETRFLTDWDAHAQFLVRALDGTIMRLAVCSDGLEDLCLDQAAQTPFSPFLDGLAATVLKAPASKMDELSPALEHYLGSDAVNAVTNDDKTLVLAVRVQDS